VEPLVVLEDAGVSLGGQPVLRDITLTLDPGAILGVSGPNGSGKTTLVRLLATMIRPDAGRGTVLGASLDGDDVWAVRPMIGLIGHTPSLIPELTLAENVEHFARLAGIDPGKGVRALTVVGLGDAMDRRSQASSQGMLRRAEIAILLMRHCRIVLLDEATTGLDADASTLVEALVDRTTGNGGAVVMVSHDPSRLTACHRVMRLEAGRAGVGS
jgi:heme exporter protein A